MAWFATYQVTFDKIKLSECEGIFDLHTYIDVYTGSVRKNYDNPTFSTDISKLKRLKAKLEEMQKQSNPAE
ncbi:DUF6965 family protein [Parabacteroides goldsteinii]|uniref:DUF6965 family protein n=1 Tax=Parabacteroides goldsteinii TaxID=328812 RepID=UPI003899E609